MIDVHDRRALNAEWQGEQLLGALQFATRWLDHHRDQVNSLNVFPIPDGDTGTNMSLTMNASADAAACTDDPTSAATVADRFAFGALMGARGNSGVILSQIFRGFASGLAGHHKITGPLLAAAFAGAREKAYTAVMRPVEGTMLTVIRVAAERAQEQTTDTSSVQDVLGYALAGATDALAKTPEMLDILRQAGVVDSGGQGVVYILEGMKRYAEGDTDISDGPAQNDIAAEMQFLDMVNDLHGEDEFGYCTNFMVFGEQIDFVAARDTICGMGSSVVAVGDETMLKVHIHTEKPGEVLSYALTLGYLDQIKIDNMTLQTGALTEQRRAAATATPEDGDGSATVRVDGPIGVIAVASGNGIAEALSSMGADVIVRGGQTMNPSTEELLAAADRLSCDDVIILPNNKNIIMAAQQVAGLTSKDVRVVPSTSLPQGLGALSGFNRTAPMDVNITTMTDLLKEIGSIEITTAIRDVEIDGVKVVAGELLGLTNGHIVGSGTGLDAIVETTFGALSNPDPELVTIFIGETAEPAATAELVAAIEAHVPDVEIETVAGNQPHYQYLISVE